MAGSLGIGILGTYAAAQSSVTLAAAQPEIPGLEDFLPEVNLFPGTWHNGCQGKAHPRQVAVGSRRGP